MKNSIITLLLILAFLASLFYGISFDFFGDRFAITVGKEKIGFENFNKIAASELLQIQNQIGSNLDEGQIKTFKSEYLINKIINNLLIKNFIHDLGIKIKNDSVKSFIEKSADFHGEEGKFSVEKYHYLLEKSNIDEREYFDLSRDLLEKKFLFSAIFAYKYKNPYLEKQYLKYESQVRKADIIKINKLSAVQEPSGEDLKTFFDENSEKFQTSELRAISYLDLEELQENLQQKTNVSSEEIEEEFSENGDKYAINFQEFDLFNVLFSDKKQAEEFLLQVRDQDFEKTAKENAQASFSHLQKIQLTEVEPAIMKELQKLHNDQISEIIESSVGFHVIKVLNVKIPENLEELIKEEIEQKIEEFKLQESLAKNLDQIQQDLNDEVSLQNIAKKFALNIHKTELFDQNQKNELAQTVPLPEAPNLLSVIFSMRRRSQSNLLLGENDNYYVIKIDEIKASELKSFEESRSLLEKMWKEEKIAEKQQKDAYAFFDQLRENNMDYEKIDPDISYTIDYNTRFSMADVQKPEKKFLQQIVFDLSLDKPISPVKEIKDDYYIFVLKDISFLDFEERTKQEKLSKIRQKIADDWVDHLYLSILEYCKKKYKIKINKNILN